MNIYGDDSQSYQSDNSSINNTRQSKISKMNLKKYQNIKKTENCGKSGVALLHA